MGLGMTFLVLLVLLHGRQWHITRNGMFTYQWWMGRASRILGLKITQYGQAYGNNVFHVSNHVSFLDILVIATTTPARFVSKHTVRYWPIIGFLTASAGTVFIQRGKRSAVQGTKDNLVKALQENQPLAIFPEGTTTLGKQVNRFHSGLFQAAIDTQTPIQPVAIRYIENGELDRAAAYIGKDNFIVTMLKIISRPLTCVHLAYCPVIESVNSDRQQLAKTSHAVISSTLNLYIPVN